MPNFEYKILVQKAGMLGGKWDQIQDAPADDVLKAVGSQGWELVSVTPMASSGMTTQVHYHFKRLLS
ncbi:MAG TPA: DUF4177 domain-containing protein [Allosphingosinicella sp.]|nr:DUF4177 domain-containing protein [Allosphingosinicella sp.]